MNNRLESIVYPDKIDEHMINIRYDKPISFDDNYPFINRNIFFKIGGFLVWLFGVTIAQFLLFFLIGARIKGRKNLRNNKKLLKNGAISVCNHVHLWDTIMITGALRHYFYFPAWDRNCRGQNRFIIRLSGGIPVPRDSLKGLRSMQKAFDTLLEEKKRIHFFPEASMWWYFKPIRPFKKGAFSFAVKHNVPIIPLAFSYREPTGLYKLFGRKDPLLTLNIGEPILPPEESSGTEKERVEALRLQAETICAQIANTVRYELLTEEEKNMYKGRVDKEAD